MARAIREREVSAVKVLEAHLSQIARHNPVLNAIVTLNEDRALQRAEEADSALARGEIWGPLHGVPFSVKDAFETAGLRTTSSYKPLAKYIPQQDATVVTRLHEAGAILLGKTNMPMLVIDCQSNSPIFGRANNPWDMNRTPGGSTGGGAAAVAAGLSPLEIGSDTGGSIRLPAHFCGVFGFKPTEHRVSLAGHIPELPGTPRSIRYLQTVGVLARSMEDLRLCLQIIAEGEKWEIPPVPLDAPPKRGLQKMRFAWTDDFGGIPVTADTRVALEELAGNLAQLGCRIERRNPQGFDFEKAWETWGEIGGVQLGVGFPFFIRFLLRMQLWISSKGSPMNRGAVRGARLKAKLYFEALTRRDALIKSLEAFLADWDAWICPVAPGPAFTHCKQGTPIDVNGEKVHYTTASTAYTCPFNVTGNPAVVLPLARSKEGLPIGVQVVGRRWRDMELLAIAENLTKVTGSFQRPPGY